MPTAKTRCPRTRRFVYISLPYDVHLCESFEIDGQARDVYVYRCRECGEVHHIGLGEFERKRIDR